MTATSRAVTSLERRINTVLYARQSLLWLAGYCVLWGVGGLIARFALNVSPVYGAAGIPLALIAAFIDARKRRPREKQLVALVDAHTRNGGLLMAASETPLGEWRIKDSDAPQVQWRPNRELAVAVIAAAFAVGVLFVPARKSEARQTLAIGRDIERLQDRVDVLREEKLIEDAQAETMEKTLDELRTEAAGEDPAKAWEALDSIDEATAQSAKEAGEKAIEQSQQLTKLEAMAFALGSDAVEQSQLADGMKDLQSELSAAQAESEALSKVDAGAALSKEQLQQIANAAKAGKESLRNTLSKLRERGLIDEKTLRQFEDAANFANRDELAKYLKQNAGGTKLSTAVGEFCMAKPGVNRGRGDAPMYFGDKAKEEGKFDEQTLPPADAAALAQSQLVAVSAATPGGDQLQRSTGGALNNAGAGSGSAHTTEVLPRHRGTVQRYFERKK